MRRKRSRFLTIRLRLKKNPKKNEKPALTEVIISQHLLDFLGDGVRVELGGHGHHLLDAQARVARYGQRGGQVGLPARGVLGQQLHGGRLGGQRVAGEPVDRLLGRTEGRLRRRAATRRRLRSAVCLSGKTTGGRARQRERWHGLGDAAAAAPGEQSLMREGLHSSPRQFI